jgi:ribosome recycling factor
MKDVKAATNDVVYTLIRNMDRSTVLLEELTVQRETIGIIAGEYSEGKVSIQEILSDAVKDVKEHGDERTIYILEEAVNKAMDKMERAFTGMYDKMAKLKIDFFCE